MACLEPNCSVDGLLDGTAWHLPLQFDVNLNGYVMYGLFCSEAHVELFSTQCTTQAQQATTRLLLSQLTQMVDAWARAGRRGPHPLTRAVLLAPRPTQFAIRCAHRDSHQADWDRVGAALFEHAAVRDQLLHPSQVADGFWGAAPSATAASDDVCCGSRILRQASVEPTRLLTDESLLETFCANVARHPEGHLLFTYRLLLVARLIELTKKQKAARLWNDLRDALNSKEAQMAAMFADVRSLATRRPVVTLASVNAALRRLYTLTVDDVVALVMAQRVVPGYVVERTCQGGLPSVKLLLADVVLVLVDGGATGGDDQDLYVHDRSDKDYFSPSQRRLLLSTVTDRTLVEVMGKTATEALALPSRPVAMDVG